MYIINLPNKLLNLFSLFTVDTKQASLERERNGYGTAWLFIIGMIKVSTLKSRKIGSYNHAK